MKAPFHVPEHLAVEQGRGNAAEVHFDKELIAPIAVAEEGLGDFVFAGAALAGDQHRGVGGRDAADDFEHLEQLGVRADDVGEIALAV